MIYMYIDNSNIFKDTKCAYITICFYITVLCTIICAVNTLYASYWGLATALSTRLKFFYLCLSMHFMAPYWGYFCW